jgi:hypothetical protein
VKKLLTAVALLSWCASSAFAQESLVIVKDGKPNAQIVVAAEKRSRMATLAALELRLHVQNISGARLPIVTSAGAALPVKIFVGESPVAAKLGVTAEGLQHGAYRIVTGPDWIVLVGSDFDFDHTVVPVGISRKDDSGRERWERDVKASGLTDTGWGYPFGGLYKHYWNRDFDQTMSQPYGEDAVALWTTGGNQLKGLWNHDEAGSCNAVYALLHSIGTRWFMPGPLGEVLPKLSTIAVGPIHETVQPHSPVRAWSWYNYGAFDFDDIIWARRLGMNFGHQYLGVTHGVHGLVPVHSTEAMRKAHPEYYALIGGKRDTEHRGHGTACFTSKGLEKETVNYLRFIFDKYNLPHVGIWPGDGLKQCGCDGCRNKTPSELVWEFADRVAREVYKTHPDRRVSCAAYTTYIEAPDTIEKFTPNLSVWIANSARPRMLDPEHWADYQARVRKWQSKMAPGSILRLENNRYHVWGIEDGVRGVPISYPVIHPRAAARDLKFLKGISAGEIGEQSQLTGKWKVMGLEHITLYVQSRFLWNADLDVDQVLDEYCTLFYGPAAQTMKEVIYFTEDNLAVKDESRGRGRGNPMNVSLATALKLRDLLDKAKAAAGTGTYAERVDAVIGSLQPKDEMLAKYKKAEAELAEARANAPVALGVAGADLSRAASYTLRNLRGGTEVAEPQTSFRIGWDRNFLLLDVLCKEPAMDKLKVAQDVTVGDYVAVSIATPHHTYYHMEINPAGKVVEGNPSGRTWKSLAEIKTERGADFWRVQMRVPVVGGNEAASDPNHRMAGSKPTAESPWYFNLGRARAVDLKAPEFQAFSPTGAGWHVPTKFGRLEIK